MLLAKRFHQNHQAVLAAVSINGSNWQKSHSTHQNMILCMTGNGHIEPILKVTKYNFQTSRARYNSYIRLQAGVLYTSVPKYLTLI